MKSEKIFYFDSAATSYYRPDCVSQAVIEAMENTASDGRSAHPLALAASRNIFAAREAVAALVRAGSSSQVAFALNGTDALNIAICGLLRNGAYVVTTVVEHNSVLRPLYRLQKAGIIQLDVVDSDDKGRVREEQLLQKLHGKPRALICCHASNLTGNSVDLGQLGAACRAQGTLFIVDAAQTAGVLPIDMQRDKIDVLCFTGHKGLLGPQGTGGLSVRKGLEIQPLRVGGSGIQTFSAEHPKEMPTALEAGTLNGHGLAGLAAGIRWIQEQGPEKLYAREQELAFYFYQNVKNISGIKVYGDFGQPLRAPIVSLNIGDASSAVIADALAGRFGIMTRPGGHCAPLLHRRLGTETQGMVRFSFSYFNTPDQVDYALDAIEALAKN